MYLAAWPMDALHNSNTYMHIKKLKFCQSIKQHLHNVSEISMSGIVCSQISLHIYPPIYVHACKSVHIRPGLWLINYLNSFFIHNILIHITYTTNSQLYLNLYISSRWCTTFIAAIYILYSHCYLLTVKLAYKIAYLRLSIGHFRNQPWHFHHWTPQCRGLLHHR